PANLDVALTGYYLKRFKSGPDSGIPGWPISVVPLLIGHAAPDFNQDLRAAAGAGALVGVGFGACPPLQQLSILRGGEQAVAWTIRDPERVPALDRSYLNRVRDNQRLPRDFENSEQGLLEVQAYDEAVVNTARTPLSAFLKSVRPEITYV